MSQLMQVQAMGGTVRIGGAFPARVKGDYRNYQDAAAKEP